MMVFRVESSYKYMQKRLIDDNTFKSDCSHKAWAHVFTKMKAMGFTHTQLVQARSKNKLRLHVIGVDSIHER